MPSSRRRRRWLTESTTRCKAQGNTNHPPSPKLPTPTNRPTDRPIDRPTHTNTPPPENKNRRAEDPPPLPRGRRRGAAGRLGRLCALQVAPFGGQWQGQGGGFSFTRLGLGLIWLARARVCVVVWCGGSIYPPTQQAIPSIHPCTHPPLNPFPPPDPPLKTTPPHP